MKDLLTPREARQVVGEALDSLAYGKKRLSVALPLVLTGPALVHALSALAALDSGRQELAETIQPKETA